VKKFFATKPEAWAAVAAQAEAFLGPVWDRIDHAKGASIEEFLRGFMPQIRYIEIQDTGMTSSGIYTYDPEDVGRAVNSFMDRSQM
jgi:hypothetical protein